MIKLANLNRWFQPCEVIIFCVTGKDVARIANDLGMELLNGQDLERVRTELIGCDWAIRVTNLLERIKKEREENYLKSL